jgi:putative endonuclease
MYYTYMLRCKDNSIYTGITTDIERRMEEHRRKIKKFIQKYRVIFIFVIYIN